MCTLAPNSPKVWAKKAKNFLCFVVGNLELGIGNWESSQLLQKIILLTNKPCDQNMSVNPSNPSTWPKLIKIIFLNGISRSEITPAIVTRLEQGALTDKGGSPVRAYNIDELTNVPIYHSHLDGGARGIAFNYIYENGNVYAVIWTIADSRHNKNEYKCK